MSSFSLGFNTHGKGRVRLVKVNRNAHNGTHDIMQLSVQLLLEGDGMDEVFLTGNNRKCVATDTCKNTVYCVAHKNEFQSIEEYGILLAQHFLDTYPSIVNRITIQITKDRWERLDAPDSRGKIGPHKHAFKRVGPNRPFTHVQAERRRHSGTNITIQSGFRNLEILKTTQSGFEGFHRDQYTSLPEAKDRLLATSMEAEWSYQSMTNLNTTGIQRVLKHNYNKVSASMEAALVNTFAGPSDKGVYSHSVQQTLYDMGVAALKTDTESLVEKITLQMPNIHNIAFPLEKYGLKNVDHTGNPTMFFPIDEPHGMIRAEVVRDGKVKKKVRSKL